VPTEEAMITRQMPYAGLVEPIAAAAVVIASSPGWRG
jgi:hypothetical protein